MTFDERISQQHVKTVRFVNCDAATTSVFAEVFKSLQGSLTTAVEVTHQRKRDELEKVDDHPVQRLVDTWKKRKTSQADEEADQQLPSADGDDLQFAMRLSTGSGVDDKPAAPSESFATIWESVAAADSQTVVPKCTDPFRMVTPCGIEVQIYRGNLLDEKVDAIVNPANAQLVHGAGAARAIAEAAGRQLLQECRAYIDEHKELKVTQAMHTTAGNLTPRVIYVIHVAGPSASQFRNQDDLYRAVFATFDHCLLHANNVLQVSSLSVPAISSGEYVWMLKRGCCRVLGPI